MSELALLAELAALYDDVDALDQGASCEGSTECCRFGCRTFYCERAQLAQQLDRRALCEAVRRLQALAPRHTARGDQPRGLSRALSA